VEERDVGRKESGLQILWKKERESLVLYSEISAKKHQIVCAYIIIRTPERENDRLFAYTWS